MLTKEPSRARRFMAPLYVLMALAGFYIVISAAPGLAPQTFGFLAVAARLLVAAWLILPEARPGPVGRCAWRASRSGSWGT